MRLVSTTRNAQILCRLDQLLLLWFLGSYAYKEKTQVKDKNAHLILAARDSSIPIVASLAGRTGTLVVGPSPAWPSYAFKSSSSHRLTAEPEEICNNSFLGPEGS